MNKPILHRKYIHTTVIRGKYRWPFVRQTCRQNTNLATRFMLVVQSTNAIGLIRASTNNICASRAQAQMKVARFVFGIHVCQTNEQMVLASDKRMLSRTQSSAIKHQDALVKYTPPSTYLSFFYSFILSVNDNLV